MSGDTETEKKICDVLRRNGKSNALKIAKEIGLDKRVVNKHLYILQKSNQVSGTNETPPVWDLLEKTSEIKQTLKPEQKPQTTRDTSEEKRVEDLLKTGGLKAHQIARDLGQSRQTINKQLYGLMEKGKVLKCSVSKVWTLNEEWSEEESDSCVQDRLASRSELFEMITELAEGGYGWVYKVKHKLDAKIYALKKVDLIRKADSEVKALAQLDHPNIVRYITSWPGPDIWTSNQQRSQVSNSSTYLFIQMEFCEGGTLTDWIKERNHKEKQRTTVEIHKIFYEIITGVEFIHANKLIHRDLKPDNILFGADRTVKIGDFGLVAAQTDQNGDPVERSNKGTTTYMSPEQENKKNYDEKTDIFPLGLIWFEMVWEISTGMERVKLWPDLRNQRFPEGFSDKYSAEVRNLTLPSNTYRLDQEQFCFASFSEYIHHEDVVIFTRGQATCKRYKKRSSDVFLSGTGSVKPENNLRFLCIETVSAVLFNDLTIRRLLLTGNNLCFEDFVVLFII